MAEPLGDQSQCNNHLAEDQNILDYSVIQNEVKGPKIRNKKKFQKDLKVSDKRGICYLSRVPPRMGPSQIRHLLSTYGEIDRIYLVPEDPAAQVQRKQTGGFQRGKYSEGWVEFTKKRVAKMIANTLNGEQIGGKRRSSLYYDIWNIKYLSKFKWDDLTDEIANKNRTHDQKLALEISAAKRERDFYLSKVDHSRALISMRERAKKKQKTEKPGATGDAKVVLEAKVIRHFPQNRPVADSSSQPKPKLSKDVLAGVFGGSS